MASMLLTIVQKTGALIWACQGRLTTRREHPDGDSQLPICTQRSRRAFDYKQRTERSIITGTFDPFHRYPVSAVGAFPALVTVTIGSGAIDRP
jgi:hypothetical protein